MADADLRELERRAGESPAAYRAWLEAMVQARDERILEAEAFEAELASWVEAYREEVLRETEGWHGKVPVMTPGSVLPALRAALEPLGTGFEGTGFGFHQLGRIWEEARRERGPDEEFYEAPTPLAPCVFAARLEGRFHFGFGSTRSRKVTPGTAFPSLSPWRTKVSHEARERRLRRWRDECPGLTTAPEDLVALWVDLQDLARAEADAARGAHASLGDEDPATEKQVKFVEVLRDKKGLDEEAFAELLRSHSGLQSSEQLEYLGRQEASSLIEALLALPDAKRRRRRSEPAPEEALPPAPFEDPAPFEEPAPKAPKKKAKKKKSAGAGKVLWEGKLLAVQPRISMTILGGDEQHGYKGYTLYLEGQLDGAPRAFSVGIGKAAQAKHAFQAGQEVSGAGAPAPPSEGIDLYKASKLKVEADTPLPALEGPPWTGLPLELPVYRKAGHRAMAATALDGPPCGECIHGCLMPVDEHGERTLSAECYGPQDCSAFQPGSR